jgi:hypothetical protein
MRLREGEEQFSVLGSQLERGTTLWPRFPD